MVDLHYEGEKPTINWIKFEQLLNTAFATYVKYENREVHSDRMKLKLLIKKVRCPNLASTTSAIISQIDEGSYAYARAIKSYKVALNNKITNQLREVKEQN